MTDAPRPEEVDPTKNVLDLVAAAIQRQDDLRDVEVKHLAERLDEHAEHAKETRAAETVRIDSIRSINDAAAERAIYVAAKQYDRVREDIEDLRRTQSERAGSRATVTQARTDTRGSTMATIAAVSVAVAVLSIVAAIIIAVWGN